MSQRVFSLFVAACVSGRVHSLLVGLNDNPSSARELFTEATPSNDVKASVVAEVVKTGKPAVVLVTTNTCPVCEGLYKSMSESTTMKGLMNDFVSVHVGEGQDWKSGKGIPEAYVPRVYFLSKGGHPVELYATRQDHPKYGYSFTTSSDLERAMSKVLAQNATAGADAESTPPQLLQGGECKDNDNNCNNWAFDGECTLNQRYMNNACGKACGMCGAV
eukprot:TRINITY_DN32192_c0_g1_i1.p1 TRINITY_DN32192_c0_g1~~TRINITY_DN32192_c0_g1_i1.p1  ORF type:complete len:218 (+),score=55.10 TRINITY_DN32192_c0_g1_i1:60-713(+)